MQAYDAFSAGANGCSVNDPVYYNSGNVLDWLYSGDDKSMPPLSADENSHGQQLHSSVEDLKTLVSITNAELETSTRSPSSFNSHSGRQTISTLSRSSFGEYDPSYSDSGISSPFITERSRQNSNASKSDEFDIVNYLSDEQLPRSIDCNAYRRHTDSEESRINGSGTGLGNNSATPTFDLFEGLFVVQSLVI